MRLPPYGKDLRAARDRSQHPWMVYVFFLDRWPSPAMRAKLEPNIVVPPADYAPREYDFSILAGVGAHLVVDTVSDSSYLKLAIELGQHAAPIKLHFLDAEKFVTRDFAEQMLLGRQWPRGQKGAPTWLPGWSAQLMHDYEQRARRLAEYHDTQLRRAS